MTSNHTCILACYHAREDNRQLALRGDYLPIYDHAQRMYAGQVAMMKEIMGIETVVSIGGK